MSIIKVAHAASPSSGFLGKIGIKLPDLGELTVNALKIAFFFAALFFLVQLVIGGFSWMSAGGDPKSLDSARSRITNAVIGLVIIVAAFAITTIILGVLGINIFTGQTINIGK